MNYRTAYLVTLRQNIKYNKKKTKKRTMIKNKEET